MTRPLPLPSPAALAYTANALTVLFLVLALPYVLHRLLTRPTAAIKGAGRRQLGGS